MTFFAAAAPYIVSAVASLASSKSGGGGILGKVFGSFSGGTQSDAAEQEARAASAGYDRAIGAYRGAETNVLQRLNPYQQVGYEGLNRLSGQVLGKQVLYDQKGNPIQGLQDVSQQQRLADFQADPGYQFRLSEGQKALERSAAARGGLISGGSQKELQRYGQDYASGEYGNWLSRLGDLTNLGRGAVTEGNNAQLMTANNVGNAYINQGLAQAGKYVNQANAASSGLDNFSALAGKLSSNMMSSNNNTSSSGGGISNILSSLSSMFGKK